MYINPIRTAQMNSYKNFPDEDDLCVNYIQYTLYSCLQLLLACIVSVNKRTCMLASFPGRLPLFSWQHTWPLNHPEIHTQRPPQYC